MTVGEALAIGFALKRHELDQLKALQFQDDVEDSEEYATNDTEIKCESQESEEDEEPYEDEDRAAEPDWESAAERRKRAYEEQISRWLSWVFKVGYAEKGIP